MKEPEVVDLKARLQERLLNGDEERVFAEAQVDREVRVALLQAWAFPPGCRDPLWGYRVLQALDHLASPGAPRSLLEHTEQCPSCREELRSAREALRERAPGAGPAPS